MDSIFKVKSIDRSDVHWENCLFDLTPVERVGNLYFKREDAFAPLGPNGINGSKLRQCIWLVADHLKMHPETQGLLSGASVKSPQLSMSTLVAAHYGLPAVQVIGATKPATACKHENIAIAAWAGARFVIEKVGYNPFLQSKVHKLHATDAFKDYFCLEYGIALNHNSNPACQVEKFHRVGSEQVRNLPKHIETIIVPAGSCNSCISVLYGIARFRPAALRRVILVAIGPNRIDFIEQRLGVLEQASGLQIRNLFHRTFKHNPEKDALYNTGPAPYELVHYDTYGTGYAKYGDQMRFTLGDIEFHPTYEAKMMNYLHDNPGEFRHLMNEKTLVWIVGSMARKECMLGALRARFGDCFLTVIKEFA